MEVDAVQDSPEELHDLLWEAIVSQQEDKVTECIQKGATASFVKGKDEVTLLHIASKIGHPAILESLLRTECDVNAGDAVHDFGTPLHYAVAGGKLESCRILLRFKASVSATNKAPFPYPITPGDNNAYKHGRTPLHDACKSRKSKICQLLIEAGASVTATDARNKTPLHDACDTDRKIDREICELLVKNGAMVSAPDKRGRCSLHLASAGNDISVCEMIIEAGADTTCSDENGRTPLHYASRNNQADICLLLLDNGAELEATDKRGRTALCLAVGTSSESACDVLISARGANIGANIKQPAGIKMHKARRKSLKKEESQRGTGSETSEEEPSIVSALTTDGRTLMHLAVSCGGPKGIVKQLSSIDPNAQDAKGRTAYFIAAGRASSTLLDQLSKSGFRPYTDRDNNMKTPLHSAAVLGNLKNCKQLLKAHPLFVNEPDNDGNTPLHCAAARGRYKICELFISRKQVDIHCQNKNGQTALHLAAASGKRDICKKLLQKKSDPNAVDKKNRTPLHMSAYNNHRAASESLLSSRADVHMKDWKGNTPLHSAARNEGDSMCSILIKRKANVFAENGIGERPLDVWPDSHRSQAVSLTAEVKKQVKIELTQMPSKPIDVVKLFLLGDPEAGKTTLKESLSEEINSDDESPESSGLRSFGYKPTAGIKVGRQTIRGNPGIDIDRRAIGEAGDFCVWDCAGHIEFHVTHSMFLGAENSIFIVVYDLMRMEDIKELMYWLSFIKASHDYSSDRPIPVVQIVATHVDQVPDSPETARKRAQSTLDLVTKMYDGYLDIKANLIVVDSRETRSEDMISLREKLHSTASEIKGTRKMPVICQDVLMQNKASWCDSKYPVLGWKRFVKYLRAINPLVDKSLLLAAVDYLHDTGEIYRSKKIHGMYKVVLKPSWLCSTIIGPAFAGRDFPAAKYHLEDKPYFTKADLTKIFKSEINIHQLIEFLQDLNLAFLFDEDRFVIPARLPKGDQVNRQISWDPDPNLEYHGISLQCLDETDMFTADVFPSLQVMIMKKYRKRMADQNMKLNTDIANGIIRFVSNIVGLVELDDQKRAIIIAVRCNRGEPQNREFSYKDMKEVKVLAETVLQERSPGTKIARRYLSPKDLAGKTNLKSVSTYNEDNIKAAYNTEGIVRSGSNCDDLTNVLCHGYDPTFVEQYGWDCDILWLPMEVQKVVVKHLDKKNDRVEDYRALSKILVGLLHQEIDLENVVNDCKAPKSSITATLVKDHWPRSSTLPRTLVTLYKLLTYKGLIGNEVAAKNLKDAMKKYGFKLLDETSDFVKCVNEGLPIKVQCRRAAIRDYWDKLHQNMEPGQILRSLDAASLPILSEEDNEEVEAKETESGRTKGAKLLLEKLILSDEQHVYDNLHEALADESNGVTYLAVGLADKYKKYKAMFNGVEEDSI